MNAFGYIGIALGVLAAIALYWLPSIVGKRRNVANMTSVVVVNLLLGWTFIGWCVALAMAVRDEKRGGHAAPRRHHWEAM